MYRTYQINFKDTYSSTFPEDNCFLEGMDMEDAVLQFIGEDEEYRKLFDSLDDDLVVSEEIIVNGRAREVEIRYLVEEKELTVDLY